MKTTSFLIAAVIGLSAAQFAKANVTYDYVAESQGVFTFGTNDTLNLYLREVSTAGSFTAVGDGGLYSGGVALVEQPGSTGVTFTSSGVSNNSLPEPNGFTGNNTHGLIAGGGAWISDITNNSDSTAGVAPVSSTTYNGTTTNLYLLGSVTIAVNDNPHITLFVESLHDAPPQTGAPTGADGNTLTFDSGYDLDAGGFAPGVVGADGRPTVVEAGAVPEPASMAIFGAGAIWILTRRGRARKLS